MDVTRTARHSRGTGQSAAPRLLTKRCHLLVEKGAAVAGGTSAASDRGHARPAEWLAVIADGNQRQHALQCGSRRRLVADNRLEVNLDQLVCEVLFLQEVEQCGEAVS